MPQGRRKVPFSGKAKKEQLKVKKNIKSKNYSGQKVLITHSSDEDEEVKVKKMNEQPSKSKNIKANRYALKFFDESQEEILKKKEEASHKIHPVKIEELEIDHTYFDIDFDFPKRPEWSYELSREVLDMRENRYFTQYISEIEKTQNLKTLSYFELNLETWRQFWRVLEISDVILYIIDCRYASAMFPPKLYDYVTNTLNKDMILVLNKVDLIPAPLVCAWQHYFKEKYQKLHITFFTTTPGYNLRNHGDDTGLKIRRRKGKQRMAMEGSQLLYDLCKKIVGSDLDLSSWEDKIKEESSTASANDDDGIKIGKILTETFDLGLFKHERFKDGVFTIGCLGQPNVGKSSVLNAIMGKKVVSVSRTPGHTKHFQTIFLTKNVRLCDCPGLVFPSKVPKALQVIMGSYPIAQLKDPYTSIRFIVERINLPELLKLQPNSDLDPSDGWSALDVCDAWAQKRGFFTAKASRPDTYRAANNLLRMCLDGKICLCLRPSGYLKNEEKWKCHPDVKIVKWVQAFVSDDTNTTQGHSRAVDFSDDLSDESNESDFDKTSDKCQSDSSQSDSDCQLKNKFMLLSDD